MGTTTSRNGELWQPEPGVQRLSGIRHGHDGASQSERGCDLQRVEQCSGERRKLRGGGLSERHQLQRVGQQHADDRQGEQRDYLPDDHGRCGWRKRNTDRHGQFGTGCHLLQPLHEHHYQ